MTTRAQQDAAKAGKAPQAQLFIPIMKVVDCGDGTCRAYGLITDETPDLADEICDYDTSAPLFRTWSERVHKSTTDAGQEPSFGNVRVMHGLSAAGKLTDIVFDDAAKSISCEAHIVDPLEAEKTLKGVYTGFSLGGKYVGKKWIDVTTKKMRYTVNPVEVSIVDLPCNPSATFTAVKVDGGEEQIAFKTAEGDPAGADGEAPVAAADNWAPTNSDVLARAQKMAADAGKAGRSADFVVKAREELIAEHEAAKAGAAEGDEDEDEAETDDEEVEAGTMPKADKAAPAEPGPVSTAALLAIEQVWKTADGTTFKSKGEAADHAASLVITAKAATDPVAAALAKAQAVVKGAAAEPAVVSDFDPAELRDLSAALNVLRAGLDDHVALKGLYQVSRLAELLNSLGWLVDEAGYERRREGDGSSVPDELAQALGQLGETLVTMAREEVSELLASFEACGIDVTVIVASADATVVEAAARAVEAVKADADLVEKAGRRNSSADMTKIQGVHDNAVALGASCGSDGKQAAAGADDAGSDVVKALQAENAQLSEQVTKAVAGIEQLTQDFAAKVTGLQAQLDTIKATPMPAAPSKVVEKGEDTGGTRTPAAPAPTDSNAVIKSLIDEHGADGLARMIFKASQQKPLVMTARAE